MKKIITVKSAEKYNKLKNLIDKLQLSYINFAEDKNEKTPLDLIYKSVKPKVQTSRTEKEIEKAAKEDHVDQSEEKLRKQQQNSI